MCKLLCLLLCGLGVASASSPWRALYAVLAQKEHLDAKTQERFLQWVDQVGSTCAHQNAATLAASLQCLRSHIYEGIPLVFDSNAVTSSRDLLPDRLLVTGKGSCVPTTFLVLLTAERMGISGVPVSLPGHVYLRFPQGINWEPNRSGWNYTDQEYRDKYDLDAARGRSANALDPTQFAGLVFFERANQLRKQQQWEKALAEYQHAEALWSDTRIAGNRALVLEAQGDRKGALYVMDSLWNWGARDEELVWNRCLVMLRAGNSPRQVLAVLEDAQGRRVQSARLQDLAKKLADAIK